MVLMWLTMGQLGPDGSTRQLCIDSGLDAALQNRVGDLPAVATHRANHTVLFLTAKDTVNDRVQGLDAGADDYLVKPLNYELLARVRFASLSC